MTIQEASVNLRRIKQKLPASKITAPIFFKEYLRIVESLSIRYPKYALPLSTYLMSYQYFNGKSIEWLKYSNSRLNAFNHELNNNITGTIAFLASILQQHTTF